MVLKHFEDEQIEHKKPPPFGGGFVGVAVNPV